MEPTNNVKGKWGSDGGSSNNKNTPNRRSELLLVNTTCTGISTGKTATSYILQPTTSGPLHHTTDGSTGTRYYCSSTLEGFFLKVE